jgi:hypothetical protein
MKKFEELLDEVLREDGRVEPRLGIERRVLARVSAGTSRVAAWKRWWWVPASAACLSLMFVMERGPKPPIDPHVTDAKIVDLPSPSVVVPAEVGLRVETRAVPVTTVRRKAHAGGMRGTEVEKVRLPKMETFPAPIVSSEWTHELDVLRSDRTAEAFMELQRKQDEPIRIAAIEIAPLQTEGAAGQDQ